MSVKKDDLDFKISRRFAPLFGTQFLGAFNDNIFKTTLFVMISFYGLGNNDLIPASQMLNLGALLFILPYFMFSALSGQLCNRFDKAVLACRIKFLEIIVMSVAAYGFYIQSAPLLLFCLFCMGAQSTLFGPLKYAILPDYLNDKELLMGNSLIESGTFIAILFGQILGTSLAGIPPHTVGMVVMVVAVCGTLSSWFMPPVPAKAPDTEIEPNIIKGTMDLMRETVVQKSVFTAIIGISWFWFAGSVYTTQLPTFTQIHLGGDDNVFNLMLALFSIGIAAGSVLCAKLSHEHLRLGLVTVGTAGLTVSGLLLVWLTHGQRFSGLNGIWWFLSQTNAYPVMLVMTAIGCFGGFFSVPLYTWLQTASSETFRAHAVAANNIVNGIFMVTAAILSAVLLMLFESITLLYLIVALGNVLLMIYLIKREPRFLLKKK
ncbi:MFS transporter [Neisseria iguanae]|uniref:MFS transporter n=1 Tax=Neisseria iguanae TaxID=90242 RepID=A0A2P7U152_9NEIS|nr:MFS transporter [Neisseria iguanae]PSJ80633.1 MFS transporter [Neisseria iguanae]